ncbi:dynamin family protein [Thiothrix unzii]|jgi:hypothetical protein|uniref:dynamin family protein n=1 Tax=Thiothrix unzii TaxID=111769 RepID=UPI002A35D1F9|nr:dynamin family protein [Thiothrix unzii]MDX9989706.1 dynamin family protein [Thiothrix unzii]
MNWKETSKVYSAKLKSALDIQRHALQLAKMPQAKQAGITEEQIAKLELAGSVAEKQMIRLEKGEFRIAVVGLEKAGKSTFINAWLGYDLLPAKTERCTFTTTQIYSVQHGDKQRFETEPKTLKAFNQYQDELTAQAQSPDKSAAQTANNDLGVIEKHRATLQEIIAEGERSISFETLAELKPTLTKYVADERYAHAMQEARLYTRDLAAVDGVVFYDVPGLDSGLSKHIEESKAMLADCDAIILVQRRDISLKAYEQELVKFGQTGDPYLRLAEKLFVFWGQIDLQPSREVLEDDWQKLLAIWNLEGIPAERIVRGSAGAHLVLRGFDIPKVGTLNNVQDKMGQLLSLNDALAIKQGTGIPALQQKIQHYLDIERTVLLDKRCTGMLNDITETAKQIYKTVSFIYPEDPELAKRQQEERNTIDFSVWWDKCWDNIHGNINNISRLYIESSDTFHGFSEAYSQNITQQIEKLPSRQTDVRKVIFDKCSTPVFDAVASNLQWREKLHEESRTLLRNISLNMANSLAQEADTLMDNMKQELWGSDEVERRLINNKQQYRENLERSFNTLFLRFARPIVEALLRKPVGSQARNEIFKRLDADIEIIDNYIETDEPAFKRVGRYARYGSDLLINPKLRSEVLGISTTAVKYILRKNFLANIALDVIENSLETGIKNEINALDLLVTEVEADLQALEYFLLQGVFDAAGFKAFREQELAQLRDDFLDKKSTWSGVVQNEWRRGNPALLKVLPVNLQGQKFDTMVSDKLRQLGIALHNSSIMV